MQHEYSIDENGIIYDYITRIDMFVKYKDAKKTMEDLKRESVYPKDLDGLYSYDDGFAISKYILDEDHWTEGFITW